MTDDRRREKLRRYLRDVVAFGESIIEALRAVSVQMFLENSLLRDAVLYRMQCISEATKNILLLDRAIAERHPQIPWRHVRGLGNITRHEYGDIDVDTIWDTVTSGELKELIIVALLEIEALDAR